MCVVIKSRPEFKRGHVGSKTRSLGQFLEKPCVLSRRHSFDPIFMKLCQNDFLTLNKRLSRRAMLSETKAKMVWPCLKVFWFSKDNPTGHSERKNKKRQTEEEVGRQYQRVDRNGLCQLN